MGLQVKLLIEAHSTHMEKESLSLHIAQKEWEVFSKLVVRGRNQHRRDKCYQMLVRVSSLGHFLLARPFT